MDVNGLVWHRWGMAREDLHFRLRIPEELKHRIEKAAAGSHRSMTAEIVARLENSFANDVVVTRADPSQTEAFTESLDRTRELLDFMSSMISMAAEGRGPLAKTFQDTPPEEIRVQVARARRDMEHRYPKSRPEEEG